MQKDKITERNRWPVSDRELSGRLSALQAAMLRDGVDGVVIQSQNLTFDRGIRYYLDTQAHGYSSALLIPARGEMVFVNHGGECRDAPIPSWARNVRRVISLPYCPPFAFTDDLAGAALAEEIHALGMRTVGLYQRQSMSLAFGDALRNNLPTCSFLDYSPVISQLTAVKSAEEWELIHKSLRIHEQMMDAVPAMLRPGRFEYEIQSQLEKLALDLCCDTIGNISVGASPCGTPAFFGPHFAENRRLQAGDTVTVIIEAAGPGGVFCELARIFCLGEPNPSLLALYETARQAQQLVADSAKPGISGAALTALYDKFLAEHGLAPNNRFVGHGQGYDMMECPAICAAETMTLQEDMLLAIHPELVTVTDFAICCDNFRVTADGAKRITRTPQRVLQVEY